MNEAFPDMNENAKRGISVTFGMLDELLCQFEQFANGRELHSVLYHERNRLSTAQRKDVLEAVRRMRSIIMKVKETLRLEDKVEDVASFILGHSSIIWDDLLDTKSQRLKRYGSIPQTLKNYLDPNIDLVIKEINRLCNIFEKKQR